MTQVNSGVTYLGVTEPISTAGPLQRDVQLNIDLESTLREFKLFESYEESRVREQVLGKLNVIVKEWVRQVSLQKGLPEHIAAETGAKIFTFGSYRLGVHVSGADIDVLCVGPRHVDRNDFFKGLYEILSNHKEVTELTGVPDAYVPVMTMRFSGISIDLLFARLASSIIPEDLDLLDENTLKNLDEKSILSLNGSRVADQILRLVPNIPNFRMALRCIKFWGQRRGIYSNIVGFLGGVSWAILLARICQLYPNAVPSTLVHRFFRFYCAWKWPNPIILTHTKDSNLGYKVWNPALCSKDRHLMPIITPAYPAMNSTYNVSESTLKLLKEEFARGAQITSKVESNAYSWSSLFEKSDFFLRYKVYLQVDILAVTEQEHQKWVGLVESKLRILIQKLEVTPQIQYAHPNPKTFSNPQPPTGFPFCSSLFVGVTIATGAKSVDLTPAVGGFTFTAKEWPGRTGGMEVRVHYLRKVQLPTFVLDPTIPSTPLTSLTPTSRKRSMVGDGSNAKRVKTDTPLSSSPLLSSSSPPTSAPIDLELDTPLINTTLPSPPPSSPPLSPTPTLANEAPLIPTTANAVELEGTTPAALPTTTLPTPSSPIAIDLTSTPDLSSTQSDLPSTQSDLSSTQSDLSSTQSDLPSSDMSSLTPLPPRTRAPITKKTLSVSLLRKGVLKSA